MQYVIIGNSAAAIGAVEGIRRTDARGKIIIISDEPYHTYARPLISYLLLGKTTEEKMKYRGDDFYERNHCQVYLSVRATAIDAREKTVSLSDGRIISYDKLLIATGSSPFVLPIPGADTVEEKFTFMTLADAKKLGEAVNQESRVLILGAGLIGLKCAEGILCRAGQITVVDLAPTVLSSILDPEGARMVQEHLEHNGLKFILSQAIKSIDHNTATLNSGEKVEFDIFVMAVGVRPNIQLFEGLGELGRGIPVNEKSETSCADIYAAGDCTESFDISSGQRKILAILPNAYMQGECAGVNMAGGAAKFTQAMPMNAIGFCGLHVMTAGTYSGESYIVQDENGYKKLFYGDTLNGYILIGKIDQAGIYTNLIRDKAPLDTLDFALICQQPGLIAFTREQRTEMLGGVSR
ncbi:MAG: FAD-dependent oxidoreductase [Peptococcaceae bacterium]|nr:FAD-dependent oxidoreductase [Peptococcaceae bacterium]